MAVKVKICGQTSVSDAALSVRLGADFIGVVFNVPVSPRSLEIDAAAPIFEEYREIGFLLTCNMPPEALLAAADELRPFAIQLTGAETFETVERVRGAFEGRLFKSIHLPPAGGGEGEEKALGLMEGFFASGADGFVLDTAAQGKFGGTGIQSDWEVAARVIKSAPGPVFIAGGINPSNVARAASIPGVYGVDLVSGVEASKGVKSPEKLEELFRNLGRGN